MTPQPDRPPRRLQGATPAARPLCTAPSRSLRTRGALVLSLAAGLAATAAVHAQTPFERLSREQLDVLPPSARVSGAPGTMAIRQTSCRTLPEAQVRRRIVDVAVQEWAFFGFTIVDQSFDRALDRSGFDESDPPPRPSRRRFRWLNPNESARVAPTIAGYWAVTPEGGWILGNQNEEWRGPDGVAARWRDPWSAAFVSWVICESGLGEASRFRRAVAHHVYIDQAIRARDDSTSRAAFVAHDIGERAVEPGDLLCSGRRPAYRTLADRRRQMESGARTHCDIVVKVDASAGRILAIGGNVRGSVSLKLLPAVREGGRLQPANADEGRGALFAHLKLRATPSIEADALDRAPTMRALGCGAGLPATLVAAQVMAARPTSGTC
jgi:hypothetical protein